MKADPKEPATKKRAARSYRPLAGSCADPHWYQDAVFYEIRAGSFQDGDGDGDGIGAFRGLTQRLDYAAHTGEGVAPPLRVLLLEKSVHELGYALNSRPEWAWIPIRGILGPVGAELEGGHS